MVSTGHLTFLVWGIHSNIICAYPTKECPQGVIVNLEAGTWKFSAADPFDPAYNKEFKIGSLDHRDLSEWSTKSGPIGVFDCMQDEQRDAMLEVTSIQMGALLREQVVPPQQYLT